jgi:CRISPR-associated endoribonuclease Cas6
MVRGSFGTALKTVACLLPGERCEGCAAAGRCLYHAFFERRDGAHGFRLVPEREAAPGAIGFEVRLLGSYAAKTLFVEQAIEKALGELGLGSERARFEAVQIACDEPQLFSPQGEAGPARLHLLTPLRMKHENRLLRTKPPLEAMLTSIHHRYCDLTGTPKTRLPFVPLYREAEAKLRFEDLERYSNRQQTKMNLGGLMGHIDYAYIDADSARLLRLGEVIGVGKSTVFGLGSIKLESEESNG